MTKVTKNRALILIATAGVFIFFLHLLGALTTSEDWLMRRLTKQEIRLANAGRSLKQLVSAPFSIVDILKENDSLRDERNGLLVEISRLGKVDEENSELRELLNFTKKEGKIPVMAHVLAQVPESGRHTILLDRGSDDGLALDMPVIVGNGIMIGKIFKLSNTTSIALLLTDTRSHVGAIVQNSERTLGVVQGKRGLSLEMRLIPQNEEIKPGDIVVTSGIEPLVPKGLVLGRVQEVQIEERNPFKNAIIVSPAALNRIEVVALLFP